MLRPLCLWGETIGSALERVDCVVVVDIARGVHIPCIVRVASVRRTQTLTDYVAYIPMSERSLNA